mgnify:CR=1 FL=1
MAFVITAVKCFGTEASEPVTSRFRQILQISFTAAAADVVLDLSNDTGTFWTSAANPTALNTYKRCMTKADVILAVSLPAVADAKARVASGATLTAGQYKQVSTPAGFSISSFAGEGVGGTLTLSMMLKAQSLPEEFNYLA